MNLVAWQNMLSPHQAPLLNALANHSQVSSLTLIVEQPLSEQRAQMGWKIPDFEGLEVLVAPDEAQLNARKQQLQQATHLVSGFAQGRYGGWIRNNLKRFYLYTELAKSDSRWRRGLNLLRYRFFYWRIASQVAGVFAIGAVCPGWLKNTVGVPAHKVIPFGYFLSANRSPESEQYPATKQAMFVGRLEPVKGIYDFTKELLEHDEHQQWPFIIIGDGSQRSQLGELAQGFKQLSLTGALPQQEILRKLQSASLMVLPNQKEEGWGFVVNEALMNGTPVFCTDLTGARNVVSNAPYCRVFAHTELAQMVAAADQFMQQPFSSTQRKQLIQWYNQHISVERAGDYMLAHFTPQDGGTNFTKEDYGWL